MTKGDIIKFCATLGCKCFYSGEEKVMYVQGKAPELKLQIVQHFGIIPDFKIVEL